MSVQLYPHQKEAIEKLRSGSILCGGVGTGKSITSLAYYYIKECGGDILDSGDILPMKEPKDLVIITTARKRDTHEWEGELCRLNLSEKPMLNCHPVCIAVDSWNNIHKYENGWDGAFYIFDEQRVVGSGAWVKSFLRITKTHHWILLSATPGDTWMDYIPVFIANGFYKNRTEFLSRHAVYNRFSKYPKVDRFVECGHLERLRRKILVHMKYEKKTVPHYISVPVSYDKAKYDMVWKNRWNPYSGTPIENVSQLFILIRRVVNEDASRIAALAKLWAKHDRIIVFYNFDYELNAIETLSGGDIAQWNGHRHDPIPSSDRWLYLVQYSAGAEGWNCVTTDTIVFFSQNYSHRMMTQAAGRIDRLSTPYTDLYYYTLRSVAPIDGAIARALKSKKNFNESMFIEQTGMFDAVKDLA